MEISWITVAAQIINFLVLVWLLQRFLYQPIMSAMQRREDRIAENLRTTEEKERAAEDEKRQLIAERRELAQQRESLLDEARKAAHVLGLELNAAAREEVDEMRQSWRLQVEEEREAFARNLRAHAAEHFYELARAAFSDLADADVNDRMAAVLVRRLKTLDLAAREKLQRAAADAGDVVIVEAPFDLSQEARRALTSAIRDVISDQVEVTYRRSEDIACGLRLEAGSRTLQWSIESYLEGLVERLKETLDSAISSPKRQAVQHS
jgi:F-type H+-transporting ATPase subunit b